MIHKPNSQSGSALILVVLMISVVTICLIPFVKSLSFIQMQLELDMIETSQKIADKFKEDVSCYRTLWSYIPSGRCEPQKKLNLRDHNNIDLSFLNWQAECDGAGTGVVVDTGTEKTTLCENWLEPDFTRVPAVTGTFTMNWSGDYAHSVTVPFEPSSVECAPANTTYENGVSNTCECLPYNATIIGRSVNIPARTTIRTRFACTYSYMILGKNP